MGKPVGKILGMSSPSAPDTSRQEALIAKQEAAAAERDKLAQAEQNAETETLLRRRRGNRSLISQYAPQFGSSGTLG